MRKERVGNDIRFNWTVVTKGESGESLPYNLEGKDLTLYIKGPDGPRPYGDLEIAGNVVSFTFFGKDQRVIGKYTAVLVENAGKEGMRTIDITDAVQLVPQTAMKGGENFCSHIQTAMVDLESEIVVGLPGPRGYSVYQLAVMHGLFDGTEQEFVEAYDAAVAGARSAAASANRAAGSATSAADAAEAATAEAQNAAHLVPNQVLLDCRAATGEALRAASKAPYIGENGNWWRWNNDAGAYVDTGEVAKGDTGNGIQSVEQTVESQISEGENVVTVTMTDGTTAQFTVRNGRQGIQGVPGVANAKYKQVAELPEPGAGTMDFIYLTPGQTEGVYNMSYTEEDGGAYAWKSLGTTAIRLTDYATQSEVSRLSSEASRNLGSFFRPVVIFEKITGALLADGTIGGGNTYYHAAIPVSKGDRYKIANHQTGEGESYTRYGFATTNNYAQGQPAQLVRGTQVVVLEKGSEIIITIPTGCTHLLVNYNETSNEGAWNIDVQKVFSTEVSLGKKIDFDEKQVIAPFEDGAISKATGEVVSSEYKHVTVALGQARRVRFLGNEYSEPNNWIYGYCFYNANDDVIQPFAYMKGATTSPKELIIDVPVGATVLRISVASDSSSNSVAKESAFYIFLQYGNTVSDLFDTISGEKISPIGANLGSVGTNGNYGSSVSYRHRIYQVREGDQLVIANSSKSSSYPFAFVTDNLGGTGGTIPVLDGTEIMSVPPDSEKLVTVPSGARLLTLSDYTSLALRRASGSEKDITNLRESDSSTREYLTWAYCGRKHVKKLTMSGGAFETLTAAFNVAYRPCRKGELYKCECTSAENQIGFAKELPVAGGTYILLAAISSTKHAVVEAPEDGYICAVADTSSNSLRDVILSRVTKPVDTYVSRVLNPILIQTTRGLDVDESSETFGTPVYLSSVNYFVSKVDVTSFDYVAIPLFFSSSNIISYPSGMFGAAFYDQSEQLLEVADVTLNRISGSTKRGYGIYKVPSGARYLQYSGNGDAAKVIIGYNRASNVEKTIFDLNPEDDLLQKFVMVDKKKYVSAGTTNSVNPLTLAHISDVHGASVQYSRFLEFAKAWKDKGYIDEFVDTGDNVDNDWLDGITWRDSLSGIERVITVIGNHDTNLDNGSGDTEVMPTGQNQWQYHSNISLDADRRNDTYNRYMVGPDSDHPYIENWGVSQPADAASSGYCYYYKDYASRHLRMIGVDVMGYNETQDHWLQERLAEAVTLGYHVFILAHFCGEIMTGLKCNYTSLVASGTTRDTIDGYNSYAHHIAMSVDAFQQNGGIFVGYVTGHYHRDMVNVLTNYPRQLVFSVSSGGKPVIRDTSKVSGCKSFDDFQIVSINTYDLTVRLIKIGADVDYYMRKKGTLCVSYKVVEENGVEKVEGILGEGW